MNKNSLRFLWLALSAVLIFFMGGRWNFPLAAWLAAVFALRFFRQSDKPWRDFLLLWIATALPSILSWRGATSMSLANPVAEPIFFFLTTPLGLIPYVVDRVYARRFGPQFWVTLVYPIAATGMDYFSSGSSPFGTFGALGYSQRDFLPMMQLAALTGIWGLAFITNWFASVINYLWEGGSKRPALIYASVLTLVFAFGLGRLVLAPQPVQTPRIAGFSLPNGKLLETMKYLQAEDESGFRQAVDQLHLQELAQIRTLAEQGANIVVLQEGAGMGYPDQVEKLLTDAANLAQEQGIYIVLPTFTFGKQPPENVVRILDPQGQIVLEHVKFGGNQFEGSLKGNGVLRSVDTPYGKLSAVICWDADFPDVIRQAGQQNVDLLFVPSNDWYEVRDIHAGMATFRAVENGLSIFRQTGQGVSIVTDAYGRVINRVDSYQETDVQGFAAIHSVTTPLSRTYTLYPQMGDTVGMVMLVGLGLLLVGLWFTRKMARQGNTN